MGQSQWDFLCGINKSASSKPNIAMNRKDAFHIMLELSLS